MFVQQILLIISCLWRLIVEKVVCELTIPVGAIFDYGTAQRGLLATATQKAFDFAIEWHNNETRGRYQLTRNWSIANLNDSSSVIQEICNHVQYKPVAIFTGDLGASSHDVESLAKEMNLPIFTSETTHLPFNYFPFIWNVTKVLPSSSRPSNYIFQIQPSIIDTIVEIIMYHHWTNFSYVCTSKDGLNRLEKVIRGLHQLEDYVELHVDIRHIPDPLMAVKEIRSLDRYLQTQKQKNILIDADNEEGAASLLEKFVLMGMNRREYYYFVTTLSLDEMNLQDFTYSGVNMMGFQILHRSKPEVFRFLGDMRKYRKMNVTHPLFNHFYWDFKSAAMFDSVKAFVNAMDVFLANPLSKSQLENYLSDTTSSNCYSLTVDKRQKLIYKQGEMSITPIRIGPKLRNILMNYVQFEGLTGFVDFSERGLRENVSLSILSLKEDEGFIETGTWTHDRGVEWQHKVQQKSIDEVHARETVINQTFRVVSIELSPFLDIKKPRAGEVLTGNNRFEGFCVDMMERIANLLQIRYEFHLVRDNNFGARVKGRDGKNDTWNGMIGELLDGTADIAFAPLTINKGRAEVVYFTEPYLTFGISVMIKKPGKRKPGIFSFLRPLSDHLWWAITASALVVAVGLYIIARVSPFEWSVPQPSDEEQKNGSENKLKINREFTFLNSLWFAFAAFVQQGVDIAPRSPGARILSSAWWFFTMIIIASYTANMAAFLIVARMVTPINDWSMVTPINDWKDLVRQDTGISYGTLDSGSTKDFFLNTNLYPFHQMGNYMRSNPQVFVSSVAAGVERVRKSEGTYAFLLESRMNEYFNNREPCNTMMVGSPFGDKGYGIATPLNSPLKDALNDAILKLRQDQDLAALYKTWLIEKGQCTGDDQQSTSNNLALINVTGVFYILTGGLILALFTSLFEFYFNARKEFKKQNSSFSTFIRQKARLWIHGPVFDQVTEHVIREGCETSDPDPRPFYPAKVLDDFSQY